MNHKISIDEIRKWLDGGLKDIDIIYFPQIDSTNNYAKKNCYKLKKSSLIIANEQTNGRGRFNRKFYSQKGNIYITIVLEYKEYYKHSLLADDTIYYYKSRLLKNDNNKEIKKILSRYWGKNLYQEIYTHKELITIITAVAVARAIESNIREEVKIKWVNDIFLQDKKVSGILAEAVAREDTGNIERAVIGIGINSHLSIADIKEDVEEETVKKMGSLKKYNVNRNKLIADICNNMSPLLKPNLPSYP